MEGLDIVKSHYVKELVTKGVREDGRGMLDFREIKITPNVIQHAEGSAQVDLGSTRVLAGVKMQVEEPMDDTPDQGNLMVAAELLPLAHADFESGPPSPASIELARVVDRGVRAAECVDLQKLFIEEGKVWGIFIDLYVLNYNGNLFDASTLAVMAGLVNTKVPKFEEGKPVYEDRTKPLELKNHVISTTFGKVGDSLLLDPNIHEEAASSTRVTITNDGKVVRAMQKGIGGGSFSPNEIESLVDVSLSKYSELKKLISSE